MRRSNRLAHLALAWVLTLSAFAGAQAEVPDGFDPELWREGYRVFTEIGGMGCAGCHGRYGANELGVGPVIRGVDAVRIEGAVAGMQAMVFLQALITPAEIDAVAHYLAYLGTMEPAVVTMRRGEFEPAEVTLPAGAPVQLILNNQDRGDCTWTVTAEGVEPVVVGSRTTGAIDWTTAAAGTLEAFCAEAPDGRLTVVLE
ncbi:MAG: cupredoxin domain-containing protein [Trueperaceae bacterium]